MQPESRPLSPNKKSRQKWYTIMNITFRQFRTDDLLLYENWRNEINAHHHMSNFYPPQFNGEIVTISNLYVWYVFLVDGIDVGTIWLEKEKLHDSIVSLGIMIGHGIPINWSDALSYCQNYISGGYTDWRMPALAELKSLYNPGTKNKQGYNVTKPIETSAQSLWASETRGFEAARFNFTYGKVYWLRKTYSGPTRVLPVRNGN
jgi:hypothetical protein